MRILSQSGMVDIPYGLAMIEMVKSHTEEKYSIYAQGLFIGGNASDNYIEMVQYSSKAKADKVMEMLKNEYHGYKTEETYHDGTEYYHPVFQFPHDNELDDRITNAGRIRNMSNEELAEFLHNICTDFEYGKPVLSLCLGENCDIEIGDNYGDIKEWLESMA